VKVTRLSVMGGAAKSELFLQILADVMQRPVDVCAEVETTCLGAAILGAAAVGAAGESDVKKTAERMSRVSHTVEPSTEVKDIYNIAAKAHKMLYPALKDVYPLITQLREG